MFDGNKSLTDLELSGNYSNKSAWLTLNVKTMEAMFKDCKNLERLDIYSWDVSNVSNMKDMFDGGGYNIYNLNCTSSTYGKISKDGGYSGDYEV